MILKKRFAAILFALMLFPTSSSLAARGPHGGELRPLEPVEEYPMPEGYSIELVEETQVGLGSRFFRIFILDDRLKNALGKVEGYDVTWFGKGRREKMKGEYPLPKGGNAKDSFVASIEYPEEPDARIRIIVSFGKAGRGQTIFSSPFQRKSP